MSELRHVRALGALVVLGLVTGACAGSPVASVPGNASSPPGGSATPSGSGAAQSPGGGAGSGSAAPSVSPSVAGIDHPTGSADVVLRMSIEGGFIPMELLAARLPSFTLYGDGSVIVAPPENLGDPSAPKPPLVIARFPEAEVQAILETALTQGGLAVARDAYLDNAIMDAPTTVFAVNAAGLTKTVRVAALGIDPPQPGPDDLARRNFDELRIYLENIASRAVTSGDDYVPTAFTGVLIELEPGQIAPSASRPWPWPGLKPADFVAPPADPDQALVVLPEHELTPADMTVLGEEDAVGGVGGITLDAPDGTRYSLVVRPRLPG